MTCHRCKHFVSHLWTRWRRAWWPLHPLLCESCARIEAMAERLQVENVVRDLRRRAA